MREDSTVSNEVTFRSTAPILLTTNLERTLEFYVNQLGFSESFRYDNYASVTRDGASIHLSVFPDSEMAQNTGCYIYVQNIDALYDEYLAQQVVHPNGHLEDKYWGVREFTVLGIDGNLLRFGELLRE